MMIPTKEAIEGYLESNNSWVLGCPGIPGKDYRECLASWKVSKIIILRRILKDMGELFAEDIKANGNDNFASEVFFILRNGLATANWQFKSGTFPIWNGMLSKAKGQAKKKLTGKTDLDLLNKGMFKHGATEKDKYPNPFTKPV